MLSFGLIASLALLASGCVSSHVTKSTVNAPAALPAGQAQIIFMRPSSFGGAIQSSVYEVKGDSQDFIAIVSASTKVSYNVTPGEHMFMVVGESADFMAANMEAGKTYYALVAPRMGAWKARFSLLPIRNDPAAKNSLIGDTFAGWEKKTSFIEVLESGRQWYQSNMGSVTEKRREYITKWNEKSPGDKAERTLNAEDGIVKK